MLTNQTRAALVQMLQSISSDAVRLLFLKHLDIDQPHYEVTCLLRVTAEATPEQIAGLLVELVGDSTAIRTEAPTKHIFDKRRNELCRRLRADGFDVIEDAIARLMPAAEPAAQISDYLEQAIAASGLDADGEITRLLRESHDDISSAPPDFNGSTTRARIALETIARRSAALVAENRGMTAPDDKWGAALVFLRTQSVIALDEENAIAKVYTLISPGAHVPKSLTDEQWALLARTFALSSAYFLTQAHLAP